MPEQKFPERFDLMKSDTIKHEYLLKAEKQCTDDTDLITSKKKLAQKSLNLTLMSMKRDLSVRKILSEGMDHSNKVGRSKLTLFSDSRWLQCSLGRIRLILIFRMNHF